MIRAKTGRCTPPLVMRVPSSRKRRAKRVIVTSTAPSWCRLLKSGTPRSFLARQREAAARCSRRACGQHAARQDAATFALDRRFERQQPGEYDSGVGAPSAFEGTTGYPDNNLASRKNSVV